MGDTEQSERASSSSLQSTIKDVVTFVGGGAGAIYLVGYMSIAAHYRALGIRFRTTDIAMITSAAWEFLFQSTLLVTYLFPRLWKVVLIWEWLPIPAIALLVALAVMGLLVAFWWKDCEFVRRRMDRIAKWRWRQLAGLGTGVVLWVWHFFNDVVPAMGISSLLTTSESAVAPFHLFPGWFGERLGLRWNTIRQAIVGDGARSEHQELFDLYSSHLLYVLVILLILLLVRRAEPHTRFARTSYVLWVLTWIFISLTPVLHGVLLRSYRYPIVGIYLKDGVGQEAFARRLLKKPPFLLDMTENDLFLYAGSVIVLPRDQIERIEIRSEEFLFATASKFGDTQ